jgi:hypothetical protein
MIGTAILSMSKRYMNQLFDECDNMNIPVIMSCVDSLLIPNSDVAKLDHRIGDSMGQLHIEACGEEAIIIRPNLYYLSDSHYRSSGIPHSGLEATKDVRGWFEEQLHEIQ